MSGREIADLVAAFSDILTVLRTASEKDKAEVYGRLGQRLVYYRTRLPPEARPVHRVRAPLTAGRPPMDRRLHARARHRPRPARPRRTAPVRCHRDPPAHGHSTGGLLQQRAHRSHHRGPPRRPPGHPAPRYRVHPRERPHQHHPADIGAACFVTIRAIQLAFRGHLDTTPTDYLRRVRLDRAAVTSSPATPRTKSVTAVAYRWGFPSSSRFAAHYRHAYGVLPPATPARVKPAIHAACH